jgi:hypothetical protein
VTDTAASLEPLLWQHSKPGNGFPSHGHGGINARLYSNVYVSSAHLCRYNAESNCYSPNRFWWRERNRESDMATPDTKYTNPELALSQPKAVSPAATGPAGPLLEGHVGAQYLLPLLLGGEARGLPGVTVTSVAFQRAGFNHPMDDVIVTGFDRQGGAATLELQAKRTITFTASDSIFASVVAQACLAAAKPQFATR